MDVTVFKLKKGEKPLDNINPTCGFAGIFRTVGVIGDSLSSGEFESHDQNGQGAVSRYVRVFVAVGVAAHNGHSVQQLFPRRHDGKGICRKLGGRQQFLAA